jgi:hypothetical protein
MPELVFFKRQGFERTALKLSGRAEPLREIIRDADRYIHGLRLSRRGFRSIDARTQCRLRGCLAALTRAYNIVSADYFSGLGDRLTPAAIIPMHTRTKRLPSSNS